MSSAVSAKLQRLLKKTTDIDKDERFMATSDICNELSALEEAALAHNQTRAATGNTAAAGAIGLEAGVQQALGRALLLLLEDSSSDVQTVSVKCLALLSRRLSGDALLGVVDRLCALVCERSKARDDSRDIYAIGLKTMVQSIAPDGSGGLSGAAVAPPPPGFMAGPHSTAVSMATRMLAGLLTQGLAAAPSKEAGFDNAAVEVAVLEVMMSILTTFGGNVEDLHEPLLQQLTPRLNSPHDTLRKRTVSVLGALVPHLSDASFHELMTVLVQQLGVHEAAAHAPTGTHAQRTQASALLYSSIQMIGLVSTAAGSRLGQWLPQIVPHLAKFLVLPSGSGSGNLASPTQSQGTSGVDLDQLVELSEHSLQACESLIQCCPDEFAPFLPAILSQAKELLAYDPNYVYAPDNDEEDAEGQGSVAMDAETTIATAATGGGGGGGDDDDEGWGSTGDDWGDDDDAGGAAGGGGGGGAADELDDGIEADDDSSTWKVRRAAVKVIDAFIRGRTHMRVAGVTSAPAGTQSLSTQYSSLCTTLLDRFKERDPHVKQHVLTAMADWVRESGGEVAAAASPSSTSGDTVMTDATSSATSSSSSSSTVLADQVSSIVAACLKQLRLVSASSSAAALECKSRIYAILSELLQVRPGCLDPWLGKLVPLLLATISTSGGAGGGAHTNQAPQGVKIDALTLIRGCIENSSSSSNGGAALSGSGAEGGDDLVRQIVTSLSQATLEAPFIKFKSEALLTLNSLIVRMGSSSSQQGTAAPASDILDTLYTLLHSCLRLNDVDTELKVATLATWASLVHAFGVGGAGGAVPEQRFKDCMSIVLTQRLGNELTRLATLRALTRIAQAPRSRGIDVAPFVFAPSSPPAAAASVSTSRPLDDLISFLKKDSPVLQLETVHALLALLGSFVASRASPSAAQGEASTSWNVSQLSSLLREAALHLSDTDLNLSTALLELLATVVELVPGALLTTTTAQALADADTLLAKLVHFLRSPLLQQQNLLTLRRLFQVVITMQYKGAASTTAAATTFNPHLTFTYLFGTIERSVTKGAATAATGAAGVAGAGVTNVVASSSSYLSHAAQIAGSGLLLHIPPAEQTPVLQRLVNTVQAKGDDAARQFALLVLGELGRHVFLLPLHPALTEQLFFSCFSSESEALRGAAALALGSVTLGNIAHYLPTLLKHMQSEAGAGAGANADAANTRKLLLLSALRELIYHINTGEHPVSGGASSAPQAPVQSFRTFIPSLLPLLWRDAGDEEESVRSLVSEVLGGVTIIDSAATLPELVRLASSPAATVRAVVITALRHALTQQQQYTTASSSVLTSHAHTHAPSLDGSLLAKHVPAFLGLLRDADLSVRRQAILTVSALALARGGTTLIGAQTFKDVILPTLYAHLKQDPSLVRTVNLGPFSHKIDDGFPLRLASFQTLIALLDVGFPLLDVSSSLSHLSVGLGDHDDIVVLVYQSLHKLAQTKPVEVAAVLDTMPQKMMDGIKDQLKKAKAAAASADAAASATASTTAAPSSGGEQSSGERAREVLRAAMRCMLALTSMPTVKQCPQFVELFQRVLKTAMLAKIIDEIKHEQ